MDKTLGDQIRDLRRSLGLNTKFFARRLTKAGAKVSRRTIEGWEQDRRVPRAASMAALRTLGLERKEA
jgi:DNA-binding transcriptional regulator YiaG